MGNENADREARLAKRRERWKRAAEFRKAKAFAAFLEDAPRCVRQAWIGWFADKYLGIKI